MEWAITIFPFQRGVAEMQWNELWGEGDDWGSYWASDERTHNGGISAARGSTGKNLFNLEHNLKLIQ